MVDTLAIPTAEGHTDPYTAIIASHKAGKWVMIAPDGRMWTPTDPMILFAALATIMRGEDLRFGDH